MKKPTQANRVARLDTALPEDKLRLRHFTGREELGRLFEFEIEALSDTADINLDDILGKPAVVSHNSHGVDMHDSNTRHFHGLVVEAEYFGKRDRQHSYRLTIRPWLYMLGLGSDCRIFENKTVVEVIKDVFGKAGFADFRISASESYPKMPYCVQYRESNLSFVLRLMQKYGLYFFFQHTKDKHELVIVDSAAAHAAIPKMDSINLIAHDEGNMRDSEELHSFSLLRRVRTGKVKLKDYNYTQATANMRTERSSDAKYANSKHQHYDFARRYDVEGDGAKLARVKLEMTQALDKRSLGKGHAPSLFPGGRITVRSREDKTSFGLFLIVSATHAFGVDDYHSGSGGAPYTGLYEFQPNERPFRMAQDIPQPTVDGILTGIVVGKEGEEIDVDDEGRIFVHMPYFDPHEKTAFRIRVAQVWAGNKWGSYWAPRVGMEVIVQFINGNPDYPVVAGCLYNSSNKPALPLPDRKTVSGLRSRSTKGGVEETCNIIAIDDLKDSEYVKIAGEKDILMGAENKEYVRIGKKFPHHDIVGNVSSASREVSIVNGDDYLEVKNGNRTTTVSGNHKETIGGDQDIEITGNQTILVKKKIKITGMEEIKLVCGASTITMTPGEIKIASGSIDVSAPTTTVKGDATLTLKGGMVLIN
jgi:type VI secretion system secreted protein VgrG